MESTSAPFVFLDFMEEQVRGVRRDMLLFSTAIDWSEPLLLGMLIFHALVTVGVVCSRDKFTQQGSLFVFLCALCLSSKWINGFCSLHWKSFASQNYFDEGGAFISLMFSLPNIVNSLLIVVMMVYSTGRLLIRVKRIELIILKKEEEAIQGGKKKDKYK